jgi:hypothetical protein
MPLFCPNAEFSSDVDRQNFVTSKPSTGKSCMGNDNKSGRVSQVFGVQLWNKILQEQFCFHFLLTAVSFYTYFRICFQSD